MDQQYYNIKRKLYYVAYIFAIVATVITSWLIVPMIWTIPMTICTKKAHDNVGTQEETKHTALGIWMVIIMGVIAGILILIASTETNQNQFNNNNNNNNNNIEQKTE